MKMIKTMVVIVLGTALQATAAPPQSFVSQTAETNSPPSKLMSWQPAAKEKSQIDRVGNMSSRPWAEIVGWHPGVSQFPDAENHESQLTLLNVSFGPQKQPQPVIAKQPLRQ